MKLSETKFNDVGFDGLYLPKELNRRRYWLLLIETIAVGSTIALLYLASVYGGDDEFNRFSSFMIIPVVIMMGLNLIGLIIYPYDTKGKQSERIAKGRKFTLFFGISFIPVFFWIYFIFDFSIMKMGMLFFIWLVFSCLQVCENKLYYKHLIRFYHEIEAKHSSTAP